MLKVLGTVFGLLILAMFLWAVVVLAYMIVMETVEAWQSYCHARRFAKVQRYLRADK